MGKRPGGRVNATRLRAATIITIVLVLLISLCFKHHDQGLRSPLVVGQTLLTWAHINLGRVFGWPIWLERFRVIAGIGVYYDVVERFKITAITFVSGMLLALAGNVFQTVFRNPIAAPSMLGVASAVNLSTLVMYQVYGAQIAFMLRERYIYSIIVAFAILAMVVGIAKLSSGRRRFSVFDLLIVAAILTQLISTVTTYISYTLENTQAAFVQQTMSAITVNTSSDSFAVLAAALAAGVIPIFLLRFSFNAVAFESDESTTIGVNTRFLRFFALALATIMVTTGMVLCGGIGMLSLFVPFVSRSIYGAEQSRLFWGNLFIGGTVLLICRNIASLVPFAGADLPIGTVVELFAIPAFVLIMIAGRKAWEQ